MAFSALPGACRAAGQPISPTTSPPPIRPHIDVLNFLRGHAIDCAIPACSASLTSFAMIFICSLSSGALVEQCRCP